MRFLTWLLLVNLCLFGFTSCGGKEDKGDAEVSSSELRDLEEEAEELEKRAKEKGLAKSKSLESAYRDGVEHIKRAKKTDDPKGKRHYFNAAIRTFKEGLDDLEEQEEKLAAGESIKQDFEKSKENFVKEGGPALLKTRYKQIQTRFDNAYTDFARKPGATTERKLKAVLSDMRYLVQQLPALKKVHSRAVEAHDAMNLAKEKAVEAEAEAKATADFTRAGAFEREAGNFLEDGEFDQAMAKFTQAEQYYVYALMTAKNEDKIEVAEFRRREAEAARKSADRPELPEIGDIDKPDDPDPGGSDSADVGSITSLYSGSAEYDGDKLTLIYELDGPNFKKDLLVSSKTAFFEGREHTFVPEYTLNGIESGMVMLHASFKDTLRYRVRTSHSLWAAAPSVSFDLLLFSDKLGKDCHSVGYDTQFGLNSKTYRGGNPIAGENSAVKKQKQDPRRWLNKREPQTLDVIVKKIDEDESELTVKFNDQAVIKRKLKVQRTGFVGLRWSGAKFVVESIEVKGTLDEEWAEKAIAEKSSAGSTAPDDDLGDDDLDF